MQSKSKPSRKPMYFFHANKLLLLLLVYCMYWNKMTMKN